MHDGTPIVRAGPAARRLPVQPRCGQG